MKTMLIAMVALLLPLLAWDTATQAQFKPSAAQQAQIDAQKRALAKEAPKQTTGSVSTSTLLEEIRGLREDIAALRKDIAKLKK